jgi:hypothetical protein
MKNVCFLFKRFIYLIIPISLFFFFGCSNSQSPSSDASSSKQTSQTAPAQLVKATPEQSLKEATIFLESKMTSSSEGYEGSMNIDGCNVEHIYHTTQSRGEKYVVTTFNAKNLDGTTIQDQAKGIGRIYLQCMNNTKCITLNGFNSITNSGANNLNKEYNNEKMEKSFLFIISEHEQVAGVKKAFVQLVKLCGGKVSSL